jgi:hypothetical protein
LQIERALYGLKKAPRAWYSRIDSYLREMGFQWSEADPNLYFFAGEVPLILVLYVDDLFLTGDEQLIAECKANLAAEFEDERPWVDALLPWSRGLANKWVLLPWTREVCCRNIAKVQDDGLQAHVYTSSDKLGGRLMHQIQDSRPHYLSSVDWIAHVSGQHSGQISALQ